ncbi:Class E vacuolar protein-sorting machinery protein hse1 [Porphyridium purpureum]|uniref:Class E vacuolar protein-sorting machinery protein hse1 n=1 Tax=Porphyridium purpureum TaxID=35688 RepID=A0A5J4YZU7_PORPP|nr:Class E vacuolar protein-sorting machinery protein hse1 [Porphyridium purpureum]|eukprot:POR6474..scf208_2
MHEALSQQKGVQVVASRTRAKAFERAVGSACDGAKQKRGIAMGGADGKEEDGLEWVTRVEECAFFVPPELKLYVQLLVRTRKYFKSIETMFAESVECSMAFAEEASRRAALDNDMSLLHSTQEFYRMQQTMHQNLGYLLTDSEDVSIQAIADRLLARTRLIFESMECLAYMDTVLQISNDEKDALERSLMEFAPKEWTILAESIPDFVRVSMARLSLFQSNIFRIGEIMAAEFIDRNTSGSLANSKEWVPEACEFPEHAMPYVQQVLSVREREARKAPRVSNSRTNSAASSLQIEYDIRDPENAKDKTSSKDTPSGSAAKTAPSMAQRSPSFNDKNAKTGKPSPHPFANFILAARESLRSASIDEDGSSDSYEDYEASDKDGEGSGAQNDAEEVRSVSVCAVSDPRDEAVRLLMEPRIPASVVTLYSFASNDPIELSFQKGDRIQVQRSNPDGWWQGHVTNRVGLFPVNYCALDSVCTPEHPADPK